MEQFIRDRPLHPEPAHPRTGSPPGFLLVLGHTGVPGAAGRGTPEGRKRSGGLRANQTMAEQGRRLAVVDAERVEVEAFEVPEPGPGQVLVRVSRSQVSAGSEKGRFRGAFNPRRPHASRPPGYTAVGRIQSIGPGVEDFSVGDRVFAMGRHSSHLIVDAAPNVDSTLRFDEGQFPGRPAQRIEFDITDEQACFSRLGDVALHGVRRAGLQPDESVVVFGQGVVGQLIVGVCRVAGAHPIVAVDLDPERLELSRESGATHTVDASSTDAVEEVTRITGGAQCVFHANREAQTLDDCVTVGGLRREGRARRRDRRRGADAARPDPVARDRHPGLTVDRRQRAQVLPVVVPAGPRRGHEDDRVGRSEGSTT